MRVPPSELLINNRTSACPRRKAVISGKPRVWSDVGMGAATLSRRGRRGSATPTGIVSVLVMIATWYGSTLVLCRSVWGLSTSEFTLPTLDAIVIAVVAIPGAVCIGLDLAANYARQTRNPKRKKGQPPFFMWRTAVGMWLLTFGLLITVFMPPHWRHKPGFVLAMIFLGGYFLLLIETLRYTDRFTQPRADYLPQNMI